ncbi:MAG: DUF5818 domain-containing protein [Candidatus Eisenbacteria bacterium]|jgi:hypothetical protein
MRPALLIALSLVASLTRCDTPAPHLPPPEPRPGDAVRIRGTLDEDVDCRLLRAEGGKVYSLSERLPNYRDGTRLCVHGTIAEVSPCMRAPTIEVSQIRPWSSCP